MPRFSSRELTVHEQILIDKANGNNQLENLVLFMESRREEPVNIRGVVMSEFGALREECLAAARSNENNIKGQPGGDDFFTKNNTVNPE